MAVEHPLRPGRPRVGSLRPLRGIRSFKRYTAKQQRQDWTCTACGLHVHPTAGTIFHKSSTSLHLWFYAMYLMTSTRCGISAKQTGARAGRHLQNGLAHVHPDPERTDGSRMHAILKGSVEADETYVGGKSSWTRWAAWTVGARTRRAVSRTRSSPCSAWSSTRAETAAYPVADVSSAEPVGGIAACRAGIHCLHG